jgi:hypothetical protein
MSPAGLGAKNDCVDEGQQQFTLPDPTWKVGDQFFPEVLVSLCDRSLSFFSQLSCPCA